MVHCPKDSFGGFPGGLVVKNSPAQAEATGDGVQSMGWKDPLEEEMATYSSILVWEIPWAEEPGGYSPKGCHKSDATEHTRTHAHTHTHTHTHTRSTFSVGIRQFQQKYS